MRNTMLGNAQAHFLVGIDCDGGRIKRLELKRVLTYKTMGVHPSDIVGIDCDEGPPVPIPNTEVKLTSVENTWLETAWEDRAVPVQIQKARFNGLFGIFLLSSVGRAFGC